MADIERPAEIWWGHITDRGGRGRDRRGDGRRPKDHRVDRGQKGNLVTLGPQLDRICKGMVLQQKRREGREINTVAYK